MADTEQNEWHYHWPQDSVLWRCSALERFNFTIKGNSVCFSCVATLLLLSALWKILSKLIIDSSIIIVVYLYVVWQLLTTLNFLWLIERTDTSCQKKKEKKKNKSQDLHCTSYQILIKKAHKTNKKLTLLYTPNSLPICPNDGSCSWKNEG